MSALQIVGAAVGFFLGGPQGARWGFLIGGWIDPPGPDVEGPRLSDLTVQSSADGAPLPRVYGTYRLAGNVVWSTGLEEVRHTESAGLGSGGGGVTTYTYRTDVAIALCEGEITGIRRIWADTKLIYDVGDSAGLASLTASSKRAAAIRVYPGTETQEPDPLIQAVEGAASTPAYRGTAYVVFEDLKLADFGNRLPNFQFEVVRSGGQSYRKSSQYNPGQTTWITFADGLAWGYRNNTGTVTSEPEATLWVVPVDDSPAMAMAVTVETSPAVRWYRSSPLSVYSDRTDSFIAWIEDPNGNNTYFIRYDGNDYVDKLSAMSANLGRTAMMLDHIFMVEFSDADITLRRIPVTNLAAWSAANVYADQASGSTFTLAMTEISAAGKVATDVQFITSFTGELFLCVEVGGTDGNVLYRIDDLLDTPALAYLIWQKVLSNNLILPLGERYLLPGDPSRWLTGETTYENMTDQNGGSPAHMNTGDLHQTNAHVCAENAVMFWTNSTLQFVAYGAIDQGTQALQDVAEDILEAAGLAATDYDCAALAGDTVRGYAIGRPMAMRAALEPLMSTYHFDVVEQDGRLEAVKRGGALATTLDADALGAAESPDGVTVDVTRNNVTELPSEIAVNYPDPGTDYQTATQYARRLTASHTNRVILSLPLVLTSQEAARLAEILLNQGWWSGRESYAFATTFEHLRLSPSDLVGLPVYGNSASARLTEITAGAPGIMQIQAVPDIASLYIGTAVGADAVDLAQVVGFDGPAKALLLDCVMLRDQDTSPGLYLGMNGYTTGWPGGGLYKSNDGGATWGLAAEVPSGSAAVMGYATTVLADDGCTTWDRANTVTVRLYADGELSSATEAAVLNGANAALLGAAGRWELLQFQTVTDNGDGTWTLGTLLRGRRGTDHAAGSHAIYDAFVLLGTTTVQDVALSTGEIAAERDYKAVTNGKSLEATPGQSLTYTGERLECLSPVDLRASRDGSGNITLTWIRRDRINAGWNNYADIPMSEASEAYEVDIYTDSTYATVKRTLSGLGSQTASYTSAQQVTDFGGNQATIYVRVYQLSASVGRGHYRQGAV